MCISARPSSATNKRADASPFISRTAPVRRAMFWSPPTAAARGCAGSFYPMRSVSRPAWTASRAKFSSTPRGTGSQGRCSTASASSRHAALGLFVAIQEIAGGPVGSIGGNEPVLAGTGNLYENARSYLMWALSAKREKFGLADVEQADSAALVATATRTMAGWSRAFRELVGIADPTTISCLPIRTSVPDAPWRTSRITLLGDAIHSMTPYRGIGANVAIKDAARLTRALVSAHCGKRDLVEAINDYEIGMLDYGFRAVRNSLKAMHQTVTDSLPGLMLSRLTMRAINALPPVKRIVAWRLGEE